VGLSGYVGYVGLSGYVGYVGISAYVAYVGLSGYVGVTAYVGVTSGNPGITSNMATVGCNVLSVTSVKVREDAKTFLRAIQAPIPSSTTPGTTRKSSHKAQSLPSGETVAVPGLELGLAGLGLGLVSKANATSEEVLTRFTS